MLNLKTLIQTEYRLAVAQAAVPEELKRSLKTNERVPSFIANLEAEFKKLPPQILSNQRKLQDTVRSLTNLFLHLVEKKATQNIQSDLETARIKAEQQYLKEIDETSEGRPTGEFIEILTR